MSSYEYLKGLRLTSCKAFDKSFKGAKCVSLPIVSSDINEVTRAISQPQKSTKRLQANKNKKYSWKTSKGKIVTYSLIYVLCFCPSVFVPFGAFSV